MDPTVTPIPTLTPVPSPTSIMPTPTGLPVLDAPFDLPEAHTFGIEIANGAVQIWNTIDAASGLFTALQAIILLVIVVGGIFLLVGVMNEDGS